MDFIVKQSSLWQKTKTDCLIIPVFENKTHGAELKFLDKLSEGIIDRLNKSGDIRKSTGAITLLHNTTAGNFPRILLVGCGKKLDIASFRQVIKAIQKELENASFKTAHLLFDLFVVDDASSLSLLQQATTLFESEHYKYDTTITKKKNKSKLNKIIFFCEKADAANNKAILQGKSIATGMNIAKQMGNLPANVCTPSYLASQATAMAKSYSKLSTKILNEPQLKKLKMNAILSVTAGTNEPAKFIIMEYAGGKAADKPYVLVGKGVTFDSGGISLKPGAKMDEMKYDMCGAASVLGTMNAVAELKLNINVIGVIGAVENLPSGSATKPGDVITSMSGQTIEILNTDAEGRLVLCDALTYVERFKPKAVIDIATLTGACVVALGSHATGLYSNKSELAQQLIEAGDYNYDRAWPMPLWDEYNKQLTSPFADIANIGGPEGGSVTAACFLSRFTKKYDWAHLDIAGTAWNSGANKGATGRPVSLLTQYLINRS